MYVNHDYSSVDRKKMQEKISPIYDLSVDYKLQNN